MKNKSDNKNLPDSIRREKADKIKEKIAEHIMKKNKEEAEKIMKEFGQGKY